VLVGTVCFGLAAMAVAVIATVGSHAGISRPPIKTVVARLASLTPEVTLTGWFQPPASVHLDATASGSLVLDVSVVGQAVHAGEQLGTITDPALAAAVRQAEADQSEANAAVAAARAEVAAQKARDQLAVGQAQRTVTTAQAGLAAARAAEAKATAALSSERRVTGGAPPPRSPLCSRPINSNWRLLRHRWRPPRTDFMRPKQLLLRRTRRRARTLW